MLFLENAVDESITVVINFINQAQLDVLSTKTRFYNRLMASATLIKVVLIRPHNTQASVTDMISTMLRFQGYDSYQKLMHLSYADTLSILLPASNAGPLG